MELVVPDPGLGDAIRRLAADAGLLGAALLVAAALFGLGVWALDRRDLKG